MLQVSLIVAGAVFGLWVGNMGTEMVGLAAGALLGYGYAKRRALEKTVAELRALVATPSSDQPPAAPVGAETDLPAEVPSGEEPAALVAAPAASDIGAIQDWSGAADQPPATEATGEPASVPQGPTETAAQDPAEEPAPVVAPDPPIERPPGGLEKALGAAKGWLTTGNVPVKLGVIVSFFGVAFLLKYAVERQVLVFPVELRYVAVALGAAVMLGFGWRLRTRLPAYALSLQGGGIGVLFLTIFAAFRIHPLIPAPFAFVLLIALTAFIGILAVLQNARSLAVLGIVGGFLAPVLISTGSGNHVALFSYYMLLNAAILGIAWFRSWRFLNVIGFAFTFAIGAAWGYRSYQPELFASTEPFLIAFFLFYQAIAILYALRQPPNLRGVVDGTLIFGTPVIAFSLQSRLVDHTEYGLAISAVALAVFYAVVMTWLYRRHGKQLRLLVESFLALAVAFATIAIPLALDDRWTSVSWALEGAALVWIGVRQGSVLARLTGVVLIFASGGFYLDYGWADKTGWPVLNGNCLGGLLIAAAALFSARYLAADRQPLRWQWLLSVPLLLWGLGWWATIGVIETIDWASSANTMPFITLYFAISAATLALLARHYDWHAARRSTLVYLPVLALAALGFLIDNRYFFAGFGAIAWATAAAVHFLVLRAYDNGQGRLESLWHFAGALFLAGLVAYEIDWRLGKLAISQVWVGSTVLTVPLAAALAIMAARERLTWPLGRYWNAYLLASGVMIACQLIGIFSLGVDRPGDPAPLPYIPVINPFDLLTLAGLILAIRFVLAVKSTTGWLNGGGERAVWVVLALVAFVLSTLMVVRGVHHYTGVAWQKYALTESVQVQSALSIYWAALGFGGMIWGARHVNRWVWLTGTALMALVVIKLFLVDLGNTGTVARIVSFLGVGVLLLVVGYLAPAPPKLPDESDVEESPQ